MGEMSVRQRLTMKRRRLALSMSVVLLAAMEAGLRWGMGFGDPPLVTLDPEIEYRLVPGRSYERFGFAISINRYGMRSPDHEPKAGPNERRILLIGDSVIYGNHFLDQTETIGSRLSALLGKAASLKGCHPLAMAMAASSWGPVNQAAFLEQTGTLDAAAAVLLLSGHDLHDVPTFSSHTVPYRQTAPLTATSDFLRAVYERLHQRFASPSSGPPDASSKKTLAALDEMAARLDQDGLRPIVVYHATQSERARLAPAAEASVFQQWAASRGLAFTNLMEGLSMEGGYRDDIHPNAKGASLIAEALANALLPRLEGCDQ